MEFVFPSEQRDPCIERNVWRFQCCKICSWSGDVLTDEVLAFKRVKGGLLINGELYADSITDFMYERGMCPDDLKESFEVDT